MIMGLVGCDNYLQIVFREGMLRVRVNGKIYLEVGDFEWVAERPGELYGRVVRGKLKGVMKK
jgi:hypothetical protein